MKYPKSLGDLLVHFFPGILRFLRNIPLAQGSHLTIQACADQIAALQYNGDKTVTENKAVIDNMVNALPDPIERAIAAAAKHETPDTPDKNEGVCAWCGETLIGFSGRSVGFFHSILYFFARFFGR